MKLLIKNYQELNDDCKILVSFYKDSEGRPIYENQQINVGLLKLQEGLIKCPDNYTLNDTRNVKVWIDGREYFPILDEDMTGSLSMNYYAWTFKSGQDGEELYNIGYTLSQTPQSGDFCLYSSQNASLENISDINPSNTDKSYSIASFDTNNGEITISTGGIGLSLQRAPLFDFKEKISTLDNSSSLSKIGLNVMPLQTAAKLINFKLYCYQGGSYGDYYYAFNDHPKVGDSVIGILNKAELKEYFIRSVEGSSIRVEGDNGLYNRTPRKDLPSDLKIESIEIYIVDR